MLPALLGAYAAVFMTAASAAHFGPDGFAAWDTTQGGCPCSNASLCEPIQRQGPERVFAFHTTGELNWPQYDWTQITTICVFGALDPKLLCHAHSMGARVVFGSGGLPLNNWTNKWAVDAWVATSVQKVQDSFADGLNIDIELAASKPEDIAALTALTTKATQAMHEEVPGSQVTYDTPSLGLVEEGGRCGTQYGRVYDYKSLAEATDFLVVMDYDSNDHSSTCPTCFFANAALPVVQQGVECYAQLGVPASKLVLAMPWYGYDYTCSEGDTNGTLCHVTSQVQISYPVAASGLARAADLGGRLWASNSSTPYYYYTDSQSVLHRVDYDDINSLHIKYEVAKDVGARGVGMWTASGLNYSDAKQVADFWDALKTFGTRSAGPTKTIVV